VARGCPQRNDERSEASRRHLDVAGAAQLQDRARVRFHLRLRDISGAAGHCEELDLGCGEREEERDAIVDAGVDVHDQREALVRFCHCATHHRSLLPSRFGFCRLYAGHSPIT